jgi:hypothetical protein
LNIEREWKRERPTFSRKKFTLDDLVSDFIRRRVDPESPLMKNRDDIVDYCEQADSLKQAIGRAVMSRRPNGKIHNHQSRVKAEARRELGQRLLRDSRRLRRAKTFEEVLGLVEGYKVPGIGPVTEYDVATRVCAFLDLYPTQLHLHAGCLEGLKALYKSGTWQPPKGTKLRVGTMIDPAVLPEALDGRLMPDNIEDFLCVYREVLHKCVG